MFKKVITATLALLCSLSIAVAAEPSSNRYENLALGLRVTKPDSWRFVTAEEDTQSLESLEFDSNELKRKIVAHKKPLVIMSQGSELQAGINPSVKVTLESFVGLPEPNAEGVLKLAAIGVRQLTDAKIVSLADAEVAGRSAKRMTVDQTIRTTGGQEYPVTSVVWIVPEGDFYLLVGAAYLRGDQATWEQIEQTLKTIEWNSAPVTRG